MLLNKCEITCASLKVHTLNKIFVYKLAQIKCNGGTESEISKCCGWNGPCRLDQGDCEYDYECEGDLVCGKNNCGPEFYWHLSDCCTTKPGYTTNCL